MFLIGTKPGRNVQIRANAAQKYVRVRGDGKFDFVADQNQATVFEDSTTALHAIGIRAQQVRKITEDLVLFEATKQGLQVGRRLG